MELVTAHLCTLLVTVLVILYSDHQGYLYFRGKKQTLSKRFVTWSHRLVWFGLLLMIASGALLLIPQWEYRFQQPVFLVKMGFVLVLVVNACAIGKLAKVSIGRPFVELTSKERRSLLLSGALSSMGWVGAILIGTLFL